MILPDIGGGEVYDALKAIQPEVKVLLASGYSLGGAAQAILERGCNDFIQKPFTIEQLSQKIGAIIGESVLG
jgi:CheY-like chemotaxis protein